MNDPDGSCEWVRSERVFRMTSPAQREAALHALQGIGLRAFTVQRRSTPGHLLVVVVNDTDAGIAGDVVQAVDRRAEQLPPSS